MLQSLCKAAVGILLWTILVVGLNRLVLRVDMPEQSGSDPFSFLGILTADLMLLLVCVFYAVMGWKQKTYALLPDGIQVHSGVLSRNVTLLPYGEIRRLEVKDQGLCRLFGTVKLRFGNQPKDDSVTNPGVERQEFSFVLAPGEAAVLMGQLEEKCGASAAEATE